MNKSSTKQRKNSKKLEDSYKKYNIIEVKGRKYFKKEKLYLLLRQQLSEGMEN
jgi:hypothetical protein